MESNYVWYIDSDIYNYVSRTLDKMCDVRDNTCLCCAYINPGSCSGGIRVIFVFDKAMIHKYFFPCDSFLSCKYIKCTPDANVFEVHVCIKGWQNGVYLN